MKASPLGVLFAIVIVGVTIEVVEQQNRSAAYALVVLLLLGIVVFNAQAFNIQLTRLISAVNAPAQHETRHIPPDTGGGANFG